MSNILLLDGFFFYVFLATHLDKREKYTIINKLVY